MKQAEIKRINEIRNKTVFETGDPKHYIRAADVAYLITLVAKKNDELHDLKVKLEGK